MRTLEHRTNNAYDTILLVEDGKVISQWVTTRNDDAWASWLNPGDLNDWDNHHMIDDPEDPEAYGELIESKGAVGADQIVKLYTAHYPHLAVLAANDRRVFAQNALNLAAPPTISGDDLAMLAEMAKPVSST